MTKPKRKLTKDLKARLVKHQKVLEASGGTKGGQFRRVPRTCPWCGGYPTVLEEPDMGTAKIVCLNDECSVSPQTKSYPLAECISRWNCTPRQFKARFTKKAAFKRMRDWRRVVPPMLKVPKPKERQ